LKVSRLVEAIDPVEGLMIRRADLYYREAGAIMD
jgi:hypothetical protein